MTGYQLYVEHLNGLVESLVRDQQSTNAPNADAINRALDGGAPSALRRLVTIDDRRAAGAFFTSSTLAELAWAPLIPTLDDKSVIVDPACGAGSLLIPGFNTLLGLTDAHRAANQLRGRDIVSTFIEAAHARLTLAAATSQTNTRHVDLGALRFPELQQGNALDQMETLLAGATHIALNPPYNPIVAPAGCTWATGKINHAALFTEVTVKYMPAGSRMVAILPEVLRSGPRYAKWRMMIRRTAEIDKVLSWGAFDAQTDIDVFRIYLTKRASAPAAILPEASRKSHLTSKLGEHLGNNSFLGQQVQDLFKISVGAVVPHRHLGEGPIKPFATARELPVWQTVSSLNTQRKFSGRCEVAPFVAIRRTSRPGQTPRALATVITCDESVAVDNHLIVARPIDGSIESCEHLLSRLRLPEVTKWLDDRYRCHHLPVEAIKLIPWEIGIEENG